MQIGPFGLPELLVILAAALVFFGPRKLPELSRALGKALAEFRKGTEELKRTLDEEVRDIEKDMGAQEIRKALQPPDARSILRPTPEDPEADREPQTAEDAGKDSEDSDGGRS